MAKSLDPKTIDTIADSLQSTKNITKADFEKSLDILEAAGKKAELEVANFYKGAKLPTKESQLKHIFGNRDGHVIDTLANRQLFERVGNDATAFAGIDEKGVAWFAKIQDDGSQVWVKVFKNKSSHYITDAGVNKTPRLFDPVSGFNNNSFKKGVKKMKLTYQQALWASYTILDTIYDEQKYQKLRFLLSNMSPFTFEDRICADPALWETWLKCSQKINPTGSLIFEQVMSVLIDFLRINEDEYTCFGEDDGNYSTDEVVSLMSNYIKNGYWLKILNAVEESRT